MNSDFLASLLDAFESLNFRPVIRIGRYALQPPQSAMAQVFGRAPKKSFPCFVHSIGFDLKITKSSKARWLPSFRTCSCNGIII